MAELSPEAFGFSSQDSGQKELPPSAFGLGDRVKSPTATDYLKGAAAGSNQLAGGIGYLLEKAGAERVGKALREVGTEGTKYWQESMTPAGQRAAQSQVFEDDPGAAVPVKLGDRWGQALAMGAAQSAPSMLAAAIPGGIATAGLRGAAGMAASRGIGGALAPLAAGTAAPIGGWATNSAGNLAARVPTALGFGAAEGAVAGATNAAQWKSDIEQKPLSELRSMPGFAALEEQIGEQAARQQIAEKGAADIMAHTTLATGGVGALTGGGALGSAFQRATTGAKGGILGAIGRDAAKEAGQEIPQSGGERAIQNIATRDYLDPSQSLSQGVLADALSGGAIGGVMGGVTGGGSHLAKGPLQKAAESRSFPPDSRQIPATFSPQAAQVPPVSPASTAQPAGIPSGQTPAAPANVATPQPASGLAAAAQNTQQQSPEPGFVRYYHGGSPETVDGPLWFTSDLRDAEGWASRSPGMGIWYVDVPADHPSVAGDPAFGVLPPSHVKLPKELSGLRRKLQRQSESVRNTPAAPENVSSLVSTAASSLPTNQAESAGVPVSQSQEGTVSRGNQTEIAKPAEPGQQAQPTEAADSAKAEREWRDFVASDGRSIGPRQLAVVRAQFMRRRMLNAGIEEATARVEDARQREVAQNRMAILDALPLTTAGNTIRRFAASLRKAGIRDFRVSPEERQLIARRIAARDTLQSLDQVPPNELTLPEKRTKQAQPTMPRIESLRRRAAMPGVRIVGNRMLDRHGKRLATLSADEAAELLPKPKQDPARTVEDTELADFIKSESADLGKRRAMLRSLQAIRRQKQADADNTDLEDLIEAERADLRERFARLLDAQAAARAKKPFVIPPLMTPEQPTTTRVMEQQATDIPLGKYGKAEPAWSAVRPSDPKPTAKPEQRLGEAARSEVMEAWPELPVPSYIDRNRAMFDVTYNFSEKEKLAKEAGASLDLGAYTIEYEIGQLHAYKSAAGKINGALLGRSRGASPAALISNWISYNVHARALANWAADNPDKWEAYKSRQERVKRLAVGDQAFAPYKEMFDARYSDIGKYIQRITRKNKVNWSLDWNGSSFLYPPSSLMTVDDALELSGQSTTANNAQKPEPPFPSQTQAAPETAAVPKPADTAPVIPSDTGGDRKAEQAATAGLFPGASQEFIARIAKHEDRGEPVVIVRGAFVPGAEYTLYGKGYKIHLARDWKGIQQESSGSDPVRIAMRYRTEEDIVYASPAAKQQMAVEAQTIADQKAKDKAEHDSREANAKEAAKARERLALAIASSGAKFTKGSFTAKSKDGGDPQDVQGLTHGGLIVHKSFGRLLRGPQQYTISHIGLGVTVLSGFKSQDAAKQAAVRLVMLADMDQLKTKDDIKKDAFRQVVKVSFAIKEAGGDPLAGAEIDFPADAVEDAPQAADTKIKQGATKADQAQQEADHPSDFDAQFASGNFRLPSPIFGNTYDKAAMASAWAYAESRRAEYEAAAKRFLEGPLTTPLPPAKAKAVELIPTDKLSNVRPRPIERKVAPAKAFAAQFRAMLSVAGNKDIRRFINGVHIEDSGRLVATDGSRLAVVDGADVSSVPAKPEELTLATVLGRDGQWVEGKFPDYKRVMPEEHKTQPETVDATAIGDAARGIVRATRYTSLSTIGGGPMPLRIGNLTQTYDAQYIADAADLFRAFGYSSFEARLGNDVGRRTPLYLRSPDGKVQQVIMPRTGDPGESPFAPYVVGQDVVTKAPEVKQDAKKAAVKAAPAPKNETVAQKAARLQSELAKFKPFDDGFHDALRAANAAISEHIRAGFDDGEMPVYRVGDSSAFVTISPSTQSPGKIQVTRYNNSGVMGDSQYKTIEEAVKEESLAYRQRMTAAAAEEILSEAVKAEAEYQAKKDAAKPAPESAADQTEPTSNAGELPAEPASQGGSRAREAKWFALGRSVMWEIPIGYKLRPQNRHFTAAAEKLGISVVDARRAWNVFQNDADAPGTDAPAPSLEPTADVDNHHSAVEPLKKPEELPARKATSDTSAATKIDDFGEKLEGARKDYATQLKDAMDVDVASEPLSNFKTVETKAGEDGNVVLYSGELNQAASTADRAVYAMAAEGKTAAEILAFLGKASRRPFNRYLANALKNLGASSTIALDEQGGFAFGNRSYAQKYAAAYNSRTDTVALFTPREAERHILHELVHAATMKAIKAGGPAAARMRALFRHVQKSGKLDGKYGMSSIDEFVAEAFSNPRFQDALKSIDAPAGSTLKSAWQWFVRIVARIVGIRTQAAETALDRALTLGAQLMRENSALNEQETGLYASAHALNSAEDVATDDGSVLSPGREFVKVVRNLVKQHGKVFVRWSPGARRDLAGTHPSRDFVSSEIHAGLSAVPISSNDSDADIAKRIAEYGFLRMQDKNSIPRIYLGRQVGVDSDGYASIVAERQIAKASPDVIRSFDAQLHVIMALEERIADANERLTRIVDKIGREIVQDGLVRDRNELARLLNEQLGAGVRHSQGAALLERNGEKLDAIREAEDAIRFSLDRQQPFDGREVAATPLKPGTTTLMVDGVERPAMNSNGKPIHWSEEGVRNFWRWFGDSQAVDADGRPLVVYHGTNNDFSAFHSADDAYYFAAAPDGQAAAYSARTGGNIMPVFLRVNNPASVDAFLDAGAARQERGAVSRLRAEGYDGVLYPKPHTDDDAVWITFRPEQIKSAIGNAGTFDGTDPDIRYNIAADWQQSPVAKEVAKAFKAAARSDASLSWLNSVQTQYHKAETLAKQGKPMFKRVFDLGQKFLSDISRFAVMAENSAPTLFHQIRSLADAEQAVRSALSGDFGKQHNADIKAIAAPLYEGTLHGGGNPMAGIVWTDEQLRSQFGLNDRQIGLYREALEAVRVSMEEMAKSLISRHAKREHIIADTSGGLQEVAENVRDTLKLRADVLADKAQGEHDDTMRQAADLRKAGEDKRAAAMEGEASDKLKAKQADVSRIRATVDDVLAIAAKAQKLQDAGYFPLMRFGRHTVTAKDEKGNVRHFSMHDGIPLVPRSGQVQANRLADALREEHPDWTVTTGLMNPEKYKLYQGMNVEALQLFSDHLDDATKQTYQEIIRLSTNDRSALRRMLKREGTPGFDRDVRRTLASFILSNARYTASSYHLSDMAKAAELAEQDGGDIGAEAVKLYDYVTKPQEEAAKVRGFLFFNLLGGSLAAAMVNATQVPMMTFPRLSQYESAWKLAARLARAARMATKNPRDIPGEVGVALRRAEEDGITAPHQIYEMTATASANVFASSKAGSAIMRAWGALFALAEAFNRRTTFVAAYNIGHEMTVNQLRDAGASSAFEFAQKIVNETQGIYNRGNRMNIGRGAIPATVMTFKQYSVMYLEMFSRLPPKQKAIMAGVLILAAGAGGLPFAEDVEDIIDTIGQWLGYRTNTRRTIRRGLADIAGQRAADIAMNGVLSQMGIDLHSRLGLQNLIPGSALLKPSTTDKSREFQDLLGPAASVVAAMGQALQDIATGRPDKAALAMAPVAVQNAVKGAGMLATGSAADMRGKPTVPVSAPEAVAKAVGFSPKSVADYGVTKRDIMQDERLIDVTRERFTAAIVDAIMSDNETARREAVQEVADWNRQNPEARITINPAAIRRRVRDMRAEGPARVVKSLSPSLRQQARKEFSDAQG